MQTCCVFSDRKLRKSADLRSGVLEPSSGGGFTLPLPPPSRTLAGRTAKNVVKYVLKDKKGFFARVGSVFYLGALVGALKKGSNPLAFFRPWEAKRAENDQRVEGRGPGAEKGWIRPKGRDHGAEKS